MGQIQVSNLLKPELIKMYKTNFQQINELFPFLFEKKRIIMTVLYDLKILNPCRLQHQNKFPVTIIYLGFENKK